MNTRTRPREEPRAAPPPRTDHLYLVLDAGRPQGGVRWSLAAIDAVVVGRGSERSTRRDGDTLYVTCPDPWMSATHARFQREHAHWVVIDTGSRNGIAVNGVAQPRALVLADDVVELGRSFFVLRRDELAAAEELALSSRPGADDLGAALATLVPSLARSLDELVRVAASQVPILVGGPTGAGKERIARAIHLASGRRGAFVPVNCGALPAGLVESELFGHKKGAFSGAVGDRPGLVASADGGTLFLDEIGDLPAPAQAALLRVLEEKEVRAVGAVASTRVDLRVVAATHRDLEAMVRDGRFREDLLARLSGFTLALPPLAERRVDLGLVLGAVLPPSTTLTLAAARALLAYAWPRHIRELVRVAERAVALAQGAELGIEHLPDELARPPAAVPAEDPRRAELVALLEKHKGNVTRVAEELGRVRQQVQKWLKRYALDPARYR